MAERRVERAAAEGAMAAIDDLPAEAKSPCSPKPKAWQKSGASTASETVAAANEEPAQAAIISYDEKPGIQAIATTAPDLAPELGAYATFARDHEYRHDGTVSLLAGSTS
jgi:hypothetical protein